MCIYLFVLLFKNVSFNNNEKIRVNLYTIYSGCNL